MRSRPDSVQEPGPSTDREAVGVNIAGYFKGVMGTGEHARQLAAALRTQGIRVAGATLHPEASPEDDALDEALEEPRESERESSGSEPQSQQAERSQFNLVCANADSVSAVVGQLGEAFFGDRYTIGFWAWEVSAFPARFQSACTHLDEVWVGSRHVCEAVSRVATVPVLAIPQPVSLPSDAGRAAPPAGLPDGFRFLFAFDYLSVFERKNPLATVEAFTRAFSPGCGAKLIIKTINSDHDPRAHDRLHAAVAGHPDVSLIEGQLSRADRDGLMNAADCYVSLHRAEGFGYTLAEAMWLGRPVIATGYSGNMDFMSSESSYLVDYRLVRIGDGNDPYPADGVWAEPSVEHAAKLMREVFDGPESARRRGEVAARAIRASNAPEVAGAAMATRLGLLIASPVRRGKRRPTRSGEHVASAAARMRAGPVPSGTGHGALRRAARMGLLRLLKPFTVYQGMVDEELLNAIAALDARVESVASSEEELIQRIEQLRGELPARREHEA